MKKLIYSLLTALLLVAAAVVLKKTNTGDQELFQANVEALTAGEGISAFVTCAGDGEIYCPLTNKSIYREVVYIQNCY